MIRNDTSSVEISLLPHLLLPLSFLILTLFPILFFIPLSFNYQYMYVTPLIYGNAISGKEVSHLWYHDLVYLHFLPFFSFPLAEERGARQAGKEKELEWGQARGWMGLDSAWACVVVEAVWLMGRRGLGASRGEQGAGVGEQGVGMGMGMGVGMGVGMGAGAEMGAGTGTGAEPGAGAGRSGSRSGSGGRSS